MIESGFRCSHYCQRDYLDTFREPISAIVISIKVSFHSVGWGYFRTIKSFQCGREHLAKNRPKPDRARDYHPQTLCNPSRNLRQLSLE